MAQRLKDSGIEWIGQIPETWIVSRIKNEAQVTLGKTLSSKPKTDQDTEEQYLCAANVKRDGLMGEFKTMWFSPQEKERLLLKAGDLILSEGGDAGTPMIYDGSADPCYIQNAVYRIRSLDSSPLTNRFLYYWFCMIKDLGYTQSVSETITISHYTTSKVRSTPILVPEAHVVAEIVDYLDSECYRINCLIDLFERSIQSLQELKKSITVEAITKGLDSTTIMKDSGIEWIGQIPETWIVSRIKNEAQVTLGKTLSSKPKTDQDTEEQYLCAANVKRDGLMGEFKTMWFSPQEKERLLLKAGDLILSEGGDAGTPMIYDGSADPCYIQNAVYRIRSLDSSPLTNRFLYYWFCMIKDLGYTQSVSETITISHYTTSKVRSTPILVPEAHVVAEIVDYLDSECLIINRLISLEREMIRKLVEVRQSTISECITGKRGTMK